MSRRRIQLAVWAVLVVWVGVAIPGLTDQWRRSSQLRGMLADRTAAERASILDYPAFDVAHEIASVVPPSECVTILAYAGPDAIAYYSARLDYLLYPRRVRVDPDSETVSDDCEYLAVFRDTRANLAASPFSGDWNEESLSVRLAALELSLQGEKVEVYAAR